MLHNKVALATLIASLPLLLGGALSATSAQPAPERRGSALNRAVTATAPFIEAPGTAWPRSAVGPGARRAQDCAPSLQRVRLAVETVIAGDAVQGRVVLGCRAKRAAVVVKLSATAGLSLPVSVRVARGDRAATFSVLARTASPTAGSVSARLRGKSRSVSLSVTPQQTPVVAPPSPAPETAGGTPTPTATSTPTSTPTATNTPTATPTVTNAPTSAPTGTPTASSTPTVTNAPTSAPTGTPTVTSAPTSAPTGTPTVTSAPTGTPTASSTPTVTSAPTSAPTGTPTSGGSPCSTVSGLVVPATLYAGDQSSATVSLTCPSSVSTTVALASSSPSTVVPATVVVPAGASSVTFPVRALLVSGPTYTTQIRAGSGAATLSRTLTVAPGLVAIELSVSGLSGGTSYVRVVLSGPTSQNEYVDIPITSSNTARNTWPATLYPGTDSALAGVYRTRVLTRDEPITLSATRGTRTVSVSTVLRAPGVASGVTIVRISQVYDEPYIHGLGDAPEYMAVLDRPAPPSTSLTWSASNDGPVTFLPLASTTGVFEGEVVAYSHFYPPDVERSVHFSLRAAVTGHPDVVGSVSDTVHPNVRSVTHPARIVGGESFQAVISLAGPSEVDTELVINPRNGVLTVQPIVVIPAGSTQATVTVTSIPTTMDEFGGLIVHLRQTSVRHEALSTMTILAAP